MSDVGFWTPVNAGIFSPAAFIIAEDAIKNTNR